MRSGLDPGPSKPEFTLGLRFAPKDGPVLEALAERGRAEFLYPEAIGLFQRAANATLAGEPLRVVCTDPKEAQQMADGFTLYGVERPVVEDLRV